MNQKKHPEDSSKKRNPKNEGKSQEHWDDLEGIILDSKRSETESQILQPILIDPEESSLSLEDAEIEEIEEEEKPFLQNITMRERKALEKQSARLLAESAREDEEKTEESDVIAIETIQESVALAALPEESATLSAESAPEDAEKMDESEVVATATIQESVALPALSDDSATLDAESALEEIEKIDESEVVATATIQESVALPAVSDENATVDIAPSRKDEEEAQEQESYLRVGETVRDIFSTDEQESSSETDPTVDLEDAAAKTAAFANPIDAEPEEEALPSDEDSALLEIIDPTDATVHESYSSRQKPQDEEEKEDASSFSEEEIGEIATSDTILSPPLLGAYTKGKLENPFEPRMETRELEFSKVPDHISFLKPSPAPISDLEETVQTKRDAAKKPSKGSKTGKEKAPFQAKSLQAGDPADDEAAPAAPTLDLSLDFAALVQGEYESISLETKQEKERYAKPYPTTTESKYKIIKEIGRGGIGRVVLWKDNNIQRFVATKLLIDHPGQSPISRRRFLEEAQIAGQLEHPNIIPVYEMGQDKSANPFFTMKYIRGRNLKGLLDDLLETPSLLEEWPLKKRLQIFLSICNAISYAHSKNVIHRDLKPANIMLGEFGEVIVMDWGLAKVQGQGAEILAPDAASALESEGGLKTLDGNLVGTPLYMSPEQAQGKIREMDHRSDIYSLGTILYEMLAGNRVVEEGSITKIILDVAEGKLKPLSAIGQFGPIPKEMRAVVQKALQYEPSDRYQQASDLASDIERFLNDKKVSAYHYTLSDQIGRSIIQYRREIGLVAASLLIFFLGFVAWQGYSQNKQMQRLQSQAERSMQALATAMHPIPADKKLWEKWFRGVHEHASEAMRSYAEIQEMKPSYEVQKGQAQTSLALFMAALFLEDTSLMATFQRQIEAKLTPEDYQTQYLPYIEGYAKITFVSNPANARLALYRFEEQREADGTVLSHPFPYDAQNHKLDKSISLGTDWLAQPTIHESAVVANAPVTLSLPEGSYLVLWQKEGYPLVRTLHKIEHSVRKNLAQHTNFASFAPHSPEMQALLEKSSSEAKVLFPEGKPPENFVYIPQNSFLCGASKMEEVHGYCVGCKHMMEVGGAVGAQELAWRQNEGSIYMQRQEVTLGEYVEFLKAVVESSKDFGTFLQQIAQERRKHDSPEGTEVFLKSLLSRPNNALFLQKLPQILSDPKITWELTEDEMRSFLEPILSSSSDNLYINWRKQKILLSSKLKQPGYAETSLPVFGIPHFACEFYALWLSLKEGRYYRLPTQWEWELAARGADGRTYPWGNAFSERAALEAPLAGDKVLAASELTRKHEDVSPWGIYHMAGSVAEWTSSPYENPILKMVPNAPVGPYYTIKGNLRGFSSESMKCALCIGETVRFSHPKLGFRLVLVP